MLGIPAFLWQRKMKQHKEQRRGKKSEMRKVGEKVRGKKTLTGDLKAKTDQKVDEILLSVCPPCFCLG